MRLLEIEDLHVEFPTQGSVMHAVEGVSLTLDEGEVLGIVGESGSGKSVTMMALMGLITVHIPPAPDWPNQHAFEVVFNFVPRMVAASLVAFWCGEFANSYTLAKMKLLTDGRWLWTRTVGSTVVGQAVDSTIVMFLAFGGTQSVRTILILIVSGYLGKVLYEVVATPLTYAVVNFLKRSEGVDVYDTHTDFNPFAKQRAGEAEVVQVSEAHAATVGPN